MMSVPPRTLNARDVATLAGLQAGREEYTTFDENRKTASGNAPVAPTWLLSHLAFQGCWSDPRVAPAYEWT